MGYAKHCKTGLNVSHQAQDGLLPSISGWLSLVQASNACETVGLTAKQARACDI